MKKLKTLTTSTAIALASVGGTAFAQEAQATPVPSNTAVNEPALVAKPQVKPVEKTEVPAPSTVKPALDAQKEVVKTAETKVATAEADVKAKETAVASTEKEVKDATQAVKDSEATASKATSEKVAQVKNAQAKNLEAQTANQKATEATNERIKAESNDLAKEQSEVATAQANLDQATKNVQTAEQAIASAKSALDGTGLANAEKDLKDAQKGVKDATKSVADAKTAKENASKADANRAQAIKSAQTDVNTKNAAVKLAKEKLASANQHADSVESKLQTAQAELKQAQDALSNIVSNNSTVISQSAKELLQQFRAAHKRYKDVLQKYNLNPGNLSAIRANKEAYNLALKLNEINVRINSEIQQEIRNYFMYSLNNLNTEFDKERVSIGEIPEIVSANQNAYKVWSIYATKLINELHFIFGDETFATVTEHAVESAKRGGEKYAELLVKARENGIQLEAHPSYFNFDSRYEHPQGNSKLYIYNSDGILSRETRGFILSAGNENIASGLVGQLAPNIKLSITDEHFKKAISNAIYIWAFADSHAGWQHFDTLINQKDFGLSVTNIRGVGLNGVEVLLRGLKPERASVIDTPLYTFNHLSNSNKGYSSSLQEVLSKAKINFEQATTASENAKNALTKASTDYARALSLKTEAEKVLADAMATPLQAQVAENNLRLAEIALENAKAREAKASEAVANFSASLVDKKAALLEAKAELEGVKAVQTTASQALENATAKLQAQEAKVNSLTAESKKLIAEKDALVKEAKDLAEQLQAYLDATAKLATAQDMKIKAEAKLETANAELTKAQSILENLLSAYRTEHAKLVDLQTEYEALVDLAEKAQGNVVAKLPDGTVIAVPKVAPTAEALPEVNIDELQKALATGKEVILDTQGKVVVKEKRETYSATAVKSVENEKMSYSRVEKAKTLPNTGTKESNTTLLVLAILSGFGILLKKRQGK